MKKECTEDEARLKAEAYCSASEHCKDDVFRKLEQWGVPVDIQGIVVAHLVKERYIDERRYAIAFVRKAIDNNLSRIVWLRIVRMIFFYRIFSVSTWNLSIKHHSPNIWIRFFIITTKQNEL